MDRIDDVTPFEEPSLSITRPKRSEPRVPFGTLVERHLVRPGTMLYSANRRHSAKVRADGTLLTKDATGSIHKIGAHVQGAEACNGWTFWHVDTGGELAPIDIYRQQIRAEMEPAA